MKSAKNILLILASVSFIIALGGGTYEHVAVVPRWSAAPPLSLSMFQGNYGLNPAMFWRFIHPVTLLFLISSIILNWKNGRRNGIVIVTAGYFIILVVTFTYFVPELIKIITTPYANTVDPDLQSRAALWEKLSIGRLLIMILLAFQLLSCLTKPTENSNS